jgi:hypothetical protein
LRRLDKERALTGDFMLASVKALLGEIIDYAGLFPPAKLSLPEAIANYAAYYQAPNDWMLGRFIVPIAKLVDFEGLITKLTLRSWNLSLIISQNWQQDLDRLRDLENPAITIDALEFPVLPLEEIQEAAKALPDGLEAFFEIPWDGNLNAYLQVLSNQGVSAKIRTGGTIETAFPSSIQLGEVILALDEAHLSFKATAGLHHPLPGWHEVSYEINSPSARMHGFLNLAILSTLIYHKKVTSSEVVGVLEASNFEFTEDGIGWGDRYLSLNEIKVTRNSFFRSIGSCSFIEPIEELKSLQTIG